MITGIDLYSGDEWEKTGDKKGKESCFEEGKIMLLR